MSVTFEFFCSLRRFVSCKKLFEDFYSAKDRNIQYFCIAADCINNCSYQKVYYSSHISADRLGHWFRLFNGLLYRHIWHHSSWEKISVDRGVELKSILSLNGQLIVVTKDGKLQTIESGGKLLLWLQNKK